MAEVTTTRRNPKVQFTTSHGPNAQFTRAPDRNGVADTSVWEPRNPIALALAWFDPRVVAVSVGVGDTDELGARIALPPDEDQQDPVMWRAWTMIEATRLILDAGDSLRVAEAWWIGTNPHLGDRSPARVLAREGAAGAEAVVDAAREYAISG